MKLLNKTEKDLMIPVRVPMNESGVYQPINHLVVKKGEWEDVPEHAVKGAKMMGMVTEDENSSMVKAEESSVGEVKVETKQISESSKSEVKTDVKDVSKKLSEKEVWDMKSKGQKDLLEKLGAEKIPKYEADRVKLILKLQEDK